MKTLKLLFLVLLIACFSAGKANSQVEKYTYSDIWNFEGVWLSECVGETMTGYIEYYSFTVVQGDGSEWIKWQDRYQGILTGDLTGAVYIVNEVDQYHSVLNLNAGNFYFNGHWNIIRKGQGLVGVAHTIVHGTANDATWNWKDGNFASWVEINRFECK